MEHKCTTIDQWIKWEQSVHESLNLSLKVETVKTECRNLCIKGIKVVKGIKGIKEI